MSDNWELETETHVYFWGGILSNWSKHSFTARIRENGPENRFSCAEQYMMARKALLSNDIDTLVQIMQTTDPREQKRLGRLVRNFNNETWSVVAVDYFYPGLYAKFYQNWEIADLLLKTGNKVLVEASPFDRRWGIGYDHLHAEDPGADWGENWLGQSLMRVRDDLSNGIDTSFQPGDWFLYKNMSRPPKPPSYLNHTMTVD